MHNFFPVTSQVLIRGGFTALSLESIKENLRIEDSDTSFDDLLEAKKAAAIAEFESRTNIQLEDKTLFEEFEVFDPSYRRSCDFFLVLKCPVNNITTVKFNDELLDPAEFKLVDRQLLQIFIDPSLTICPDDRMNSEYTAGKGDSTPADILSALNSQIAYLFENAGDCEGCNSGSREFENTIKRHSFPIAEMTGCFI